nr:hypothetical protein [Achromobacter xylosoxidans]
MHNEPEVPARFVGWRSVSDDRTSSSGDILFTIQKPLPPPAGYASWLDYAVEAFSTRQAWLESLWETWVDDTAVELRPAKRSAKSCAVLELRGPAQGGRSC